MFDLYYFFFLLFFIGKDTLRCLGLATVDNPATKEDMDLSDPKYFVQYEVSTLCPISLAPYSALCKVFFTSYIF